MKRSVVLVTGLMFLLCFTSWAEAIKIKIAEERSGVAVVQGSEAERKATIFWEGASVSQVNPNGDFSFSGVLPTDCVGTLSDGVSTIAVAVANCTPVVSVPVPQTGQTICYDLNAVPINCYGTGQDGELTKGVALPTPRFTDNFNGTFTDNLSGLVWLKTANCFGQRLWTDALAEVSGLAHGACGLVDGSVAGQWRLPNIRELHSLINFKFGGPALSKPNGTEQCQILSLWNNVNTCPFDNLQLGNTDIYYWSSTAGSGPFVFGPAIAWVVEFNGGAATYVLLDSSPNGFVMAVRDGP